MQASEICKLRNGLNCEALKYEGGKHNLQISCDAVNETKSTSVSIDVYSSKLRHCRNIIPHRIVRPLHKSTVDHKAHFTHFIKDILKNNCNIEQYVADNQKRAVGKNTYNHASLFPCEYCFAKAVRFVVENNDEATKKKLRKIRDELRTQSNEDDAIDFTALEKQIEKAEKELKTRKRSHLVMPAETRNGEPRTTEKIRKIVNDIEERGPLSKEEARGVKGSSPLLEIPNFDYVLDSPTEYLHSVCIGVAKRMIELAFNVGESRSREITTKLADVAKFNELMQFMKVTHEFSRRIRDLDFAVMKGQEFRNIVLFFFPVVMTCMCNEKERKLWLLFAYMIRSCILPTKEFRVIDESNVQNACEKFYKLYESLYGQTNCTYNTHVVGSHLLEMRVHGPLTLTSAFGFESFYGELRHAFTPGTQSTLKQIFKKILIKRALSYHCCKTSIHYSDHETGLEDNTLIYCFEDLTHKIYKIIKVNQTSVICLKQNRHNYSFPEIPNLDVSKIGIYKKGLLTNEKVRIPKENIDGKVLLVNDLFITCPNDVLREK